MPVKSYLNIIQNTKINFIALVYERCDLQHFSATKSAQDISAQHNRRRKKMNQLCCIRCCLKKNSCAKLIVLRLMVTQYIGNMIVFLRCHYAHLSITITSKLSALNHNKILYYCNCHATIFSSVHMFAIFFGSCENK